MPLTTIIVDARPIAVTRVCIGLAAIPVAFESFAVLLQVTRDRLHMPTSIPLPVPSQTGLLSLFVLAIIAAVLLVIGWMTAEASATLAVLNAAALACDAQVYSNHAFLLMLLCTYLAFARADTAFSLAARKRRGVSEGVPWWPQLLLMTQVSICYLFAGLSKVNAVWFGGPYLADQLRFELPGMVVMVLPTVVVATEILLAFALWLPLTRFLAVIVGLSLHGSIVVLIDADPWVFVAFGLMCVAVYPLFLTRQAAVEGESPVRRVVIWDDQCTYCRRWVLTFKRLDWERRHVFVGSSDPRAFDDSRVTPARAALAIQLLEGELHVEGFEAVRRILASCPPTAWLGPVLAIPSVHRLGDRTYDRVAAHRTCSLPESPVAER